MENTDYLNVLKFLQSYKDSEYHEIETLIGGNEAYKTSKHFRSTIKTMVEKGWIEKMAGTGEINRINQFISESNSEILLKNVYKPLSARITIKGRKEYSELNKEKTSSRNIQKWQLVVAIIALIIALMALYFKVNSDSKLQ